mmetsp:Transcript_23837/g.61211  ORF Transcript_23837/g.61211 Transcript_23837/m.61211 type:complete len:218 (-) Transcript_23837:19-672(-)
MAWSQSMPGSSRPSFWSSRSASSRVAESCVEKDLSRRPLRRSSTNTVVCLLPSTSALSTVMLGDSSTSSGIVTGSFCTPAASPSCWYVYRLPSAPGKISGGPSPLCRPPPDAEDDTSGRPDLNRHRSSPVAVSSAASEPSSRPTTTLSLPSRTGSHAWMASCPSVRGAAPSPPASSSSSSRRSGRSSGSLSGGAPSERWRPSMDGIAASMEAASRPP